MKNDEELKIDLTFKSVVGNITFMVLFFLLLAWPLVLCLVSAIWFGGFTETTMEYGKDVEHTMWFGVVLAGCMTSFLWFCIMGIFLPRIRN